MNVTDEELLSGVKSMADLMAMDFSHSTPARDLIVSGRCSPMCLMAWGESETKCSCPCQGRFHGALAYAEVTQNDPVYWIGPELPPTPPLTAAPEFECASCGRKIAKTKVHYLFDSDVLCGRCVEGGQKGHASRYPDCPERWHDMYDHLRMHGTRAGIAAKLGVWGTNA